MQLPAIDPAVRARWERAAAGQAERLSSAEQLFGWLLRLNADLHAPGGCPWDREQSLGSLRQYVREEAEEVVGAIDAILEYEDSLRSAAGAPLANPAPPDGDDKARSAKKGHSIAHHPHRSDFDSAASASGAPLPPRSAEQQAALDALYSQLCEELGDLVLQVTFLGDILTGMRRGGAEQALALVVEKLIRRHPHVYGEASAASSAEVLANWEKIKQAEKNGKPS